MAFLFFLGPSFTFLIFITSSSPQMPLDTVSHGFRPLGSPPQLGFTRGPSPWGPLTTAPIGVSPGLPLPPRAFPQPLACFRDPGPPLVPSGPLLLCGHGQRQVPEEGDVAGGHLKISLSENVIFSHYSPTSLIP